MGSRNRWGTTTVLAVPLAAVTAAAAIAMAEVSPAAAVPSATPGSTASPPPGLLPSILPTALPSILPTALPSILPTALPSLPLPTPSLPSLPLPAPSLPSLLLPTTSSSPSGTGSGQSAVPGPTSGPAAGGSPRAGSPAKTSSGSDGHSGGTSAAASSQSGAAGIPVSFSADGPPPAVSLLPANAVGYALPVPASVVGTDPALIGEGASAPRRARPAGPVTIPVPAGTGVDAVTAGVARAIPAGNGTSAIVLSGADGATYTYRNVITSATGVRTVNAGTQIGTSGPGGLTFSISVPDVRGLVDADEAMQAWASGLSPDVRSLPSTIASSVTAPARDQVLLVTSPGGPAAAGDLAKSLSMSLAGPLVQVRDATLTDATATRQTVTQQPVTRQIAAPGAPELTIAALPDGTPAQAAGLASALPAGHELLWVAPPGTTPKQAAAYRAIVAARPGFRVESLPAALAQGKSGPARARDVATATLVAAYASTAYRLHSVSSQADAVLSWAEAQLGKSSSGLVTDALAQAGIAVPQGADAEWQQTSAHSVPEGRLAPGDLVFFRGPDGTSTSPGGAGIYAGDGEIVGAPSGGAPVRLEPLAGLSGQVGSTDPYTPAPESALASGLGSWLTAPVAALAVPGAPGQYEDFARQLSDAAWGPGQFAYLYALWERESGWNPAALNPVSGAFGIPQSLPAGKMAAAGPDWASDPYTQIIWGIDYISAAYGDPQAAWAHELADNWY